MTREGTFALLDLLDDEATDRETEAHNFAAVGAFDAEADVRARAGRLREASQRIRDAIEHERANAGVNEYHAGAADMLSLINTGERGRLVAILRSPFHAARCTKPDCDCKPCPCGDTARPGHPIGMWCQGGRARWRYMNPTTHKRDGCVDRDCSLHRR